MLLSNVCKGQLNNRLPKRGIALSRLDCLRGPDDIKDKCRLTLLVALFAHFAEGERDADTAVVASSSCSVLLWDVLLLHRFDELVVHHVDKHFAARLRVNSLYDESFFGLNCRAAFFINDRLAIGTNVALAENSLQFWREFSFLEPLSELEKLLLRKLLQTRRQLAMGHLSSSGVVDVEKWRRSG